MPISHMIPDLVRLYKACNDDGADVAIGSRYISGVNVVNWPLIKGSDVIFCFNLCKADYRNEDHGYNGRIRLLQKRSS